jgi:HK97 family phage major capsid protein
MTLAQMRAAKAAALDALHKKRKAAFDACKAHVEKPNFAKADQPEYDRLKKSVEDVDLEIKVTGEEWDSQISRAETVRDLEAGGAKTIDGQDARTVPAEVHDDPWGNEAHAKARGLVTNKGLMVGGIAKAIAAAGGSPFQAADAARQIYGDRHPITVAIQRALQGGVDITGKALAAAIGASGGFIVPPQFVNEIIELLRPRAVIRSSNPRTMPMPRGTMTFPAQTAAAQATYGGESAPITSSQQQLGQIIATYKKLRALVPVTNDLMRYSDPAADAFVRDDLVKVMALREDLAFLTGDGTQDSPRGLLSFANAWVAQNGGTVGSWLSTGNSTYAVNGATGGNFITSTEAYTLTTVANELGGMVNKLDTANVAEDRRKWFFHPRVFNYLNNLLNSLGVYVYRDELSKGTLLGYPFAKSTQIPINLCDTNGAQTTGTFIFLAEMDDAMLLDSMTLELAVSREGTFVDTTGTMQSAFANDLTLIRAIAEHDFQMRHNASIAIDQGVLWAPALS